MKRQVTRIFHTPRTLINITALARWVGALGPWQRFQQFVSQRQLNRLTFAIALLHRAKAAVLMSGRSRLVATLGLLLLTGLFVPSASAAPFHEAEVRKAVETWVHHVTAQRRPDAVIESVEPYVRNGVTAAYVIQFAKGGYCLAGADSVVLPVYWYCPQGSYDPQNPGCQVILQEIADRLEYLKGLKATGNPRLKLHQAALDERAALWANLITDTPPPGPSPSGPMPNLVQSQLQLPLTSKWGQGSPYNDDCPAVPAIPAGADNHCLVGCGATALAQVLYYWRWPYTGVGTASETYHFRSTSMTLTTSLDINPMIPANWSGGRLWWSAGTLSLTGSWDASLLAAAKTITNNSSFQGAVQSLYNSMQDQQTAVSADFGAATYNWGVMKDINNDPPDAGGAEVARLSFHAGMSLNMDYGLSGSASDPSSIPGALSQHFRYDSDATDNSLDVNKMVEEIQWERPLIMAGFDITGTGHGWVIYGYNQGTSPWQFNMNMGWSGNADGLYSLDLVPRGLTNNLSHITRIAPKDVVRFVGAGGSGSGSPGSPYQNIEEGIAKAANGTTLIFKAGSYNSFSASQLVVNKPLQLKAINATIGK
ncbi:MAG TPA: C10 family peptidase [Candidatus Binatia bacterium]|jgi:hypothetical protein|nr:C10 family peptidase [Candidatus Binatia bacterium]